ncbi:MAG TPA: ATP-dependent DNA helicase [Rhodanobacteraceae bacterium]|nr:ATP-dependent DNA helicase [Rhodanobacteraceae bacterium]
MIDLDEVGALLGAEGPFARELPGFAPRESQQAMARAVAQAMDDGEPLLVEAGTGTGKTFAYLVPALASGKRVIVSTGTKTLQDQLFHRDLPRVRAALGLPLKAALLKGRANYLCHYRLEQVVADGGALAPAQAAQLRGIREWAAGTVSGDRMELDAVPESSPLWPRVTSTVENCLGAECAFFDDCHVFKARRAAQEADVVVVNHHLLLADLALKQDGFGELLPPAEVFVVDEAHQLPELAGQFFSQTVSARQLLELRRDALAECAEVSAALSLLQAPLGALDLAVKRARLALHALPSRGAFDVVESDAACAEALAGLAAALEALADALADQAERSRGLALVAERAQALAGRLQRVLDGAADDAEVRWYETSAHGFSLSVTPLDLASPLRLRREATGAAWVFTSATLSVAGRFDHFARQLGLDAPRTLALQSPFDFQRQALCYLPPGLPDPSAGDYTERVVEACLPVLEASRGRAFLLFTSHRALRRAAELLEGRLPYPLLVQGSAPRHALLQRFREAGDAVLLGAASFWEGVDVVGEALSCVVIDKLPFAAPDDPVLVARLNALREAGANPFTAWQIPSAAIALKQGAGRLIRSEHDRGVLVLCDPRLGGRGYGKIFLASLPPLPRSDDIEDVRRFFATAGQLAQCPP